MNIKLVRISMDYEKQIKDMLDEWVLYNNTHDTNHSPWAIFSDHTDFNDYIIKTKERENPKDPRYVPASTYYAYDIDNDIMVGAVNIRHYLNESLLFNGGHIGDGIRPSRRNMGYGKEMIRLALIECKKLGIDKVLMVCDKSNIASAKTIIKNGGILENEVEDDGIIIQRYWITLK